MSVVGEIFLSAAIGVLFEKLASGVLLTFARHEQIQTQMMKWRKTLLEIRAVVDDAEQQQITNRAVNLWLEDLSDLAYDLDDILDEFATEALRRKLMTEPQASTSKIRTLIPTCCTRFNPSDVRFDFEMRPDIEEITTRLQEISKQSTELGLHKAVMGGTSVQAWQRPPPTTSLIHESGIHGRDRDKEDIIQFLQSEESSDNKVGVLPIVGMGGVGKTTLAQMVYNDAVDSNATVKKHFDPKAWICVSDDFDITRITKEISDSVGIDTSGSKSLDQLQVRLKQTLAGKKFLIVLDDVWARNYNQWNILMSPFSDGAQGSKVIVTTRDTEVALMTGTVQCHILHRLSEEDCWSVFKQHAFGSRSSNANPNFESIGREIVKKCGRLPLAARTLGGLLRGKHRENEWKQVLNSKIWEFKESDILPALRLSYHHLPPHLKQCFAYCAILPKDYEFEEEELVLLWMAEGFIHQQKGEEQMEDVGGDYFRELLSRSFIQPSSSSESTKFVMHDLINDLAQFVARHTCFRLEDKRLKDLKRARHSSYVQGRFDGIEKFKNFYEAKHLRTFLPILLTKDFNFNLTNNVPLDLLPKMKCLRVLSLSRYQIYEVPNLIGELKRLRYLNLSDTPIKRLPESVGTLYNLQTLMLRGCGNLKKFPASMGKLINLSHLDITDADSLEEMPLGIGELKSLQKLSNFILTKDNGFRIKELGNLTHLGGMLQISGLQNVVDLVDARRASLKDKQSLDVLSMVWSMRSDDLRNERVETDVLEMLRPHYNLKELSIRFYHGSGFPSWMGDPQFSYMTCISLRNCEKCTALPPLGKLCSLKKLFIVGMSGVKHVGSEFYGQGCSNPFPVLEILRFENMPEWQDWSAYGGDKEVRTFNRLIELRIKSCPKLLGTVPTDLPSLRTLEIEDCPKLLIDVPSLVLQSLTSMSVKNVPVPGLPLLHETRTKLQLSSLKSLDIRDVSIPDTFYDPTIADEVLLDNVASHHLSSLTSLCLREIPKLRFLPKWLTEGLKGLEDLEINECTHLTTLWQDVARLQQCLPALQRMKIEKCPQLVSLFEEKEETQQQQQREGLSFMMRLESLQFEDCEKLGKLPRGLHTFPFLGQLTIYNCSSLVSFPEKGLPSTLRELNITDCGALQALPEWVEHNNYALEELEIYDCPALKYIISSRGGLPQTLKRLDIGRCPTLESVVAEEGMKINFPSIESFFIRNCENLKSLPVALHNDNNLKNLSRLQIRGCDNLESLPEGWFYLATNLRQLKISNCKKLEALPQCLQNNSNYYNNSLTALESLEVGGLGTSVLNKISLHRFSSLRELTIDGPSSGEEEEGEDVQWSIFPVDGMFLPTSLIKLDLWDFPKLEELSSTEFQKLTSLQRLQIEDCPSLASFPKEGFPPSLLSLTIFQCPILKQRCEKGKGQYWPLIAHIPEVDIDYRSIFKPEEK